MNRRFDADRLPPLLDSTALPRVLSRAEALTRGYSRHAIDRRVATRRWRRILPHTYLTVDTLTTLDRCNAALALAGRDALLSGAAALYPAELRSVPRPGTVLVLVPVGNRTRSVEWVRIRRTRRMPSAELWYGPPRAAVARAVADHALGLSRLDEVRTLLAEVIRRELCSTADLEIELTAGMRNGSAHLRRALAEVVGGAHSAPEAEAARLLRRGGIGGFGQNVRIELPGGGYVVADFLWRRLRAILEIDSREYHFDPADWRATMDRHLALTTLGFSVVHRPPSAVYREPARFVRDIAAWLAALPSA